MIILKMHTCSNKNKKWPHEPELKIKYKTIKEAIFEGKKLVEKNKRHAYINWNSRKGFRYLINYPSLEIDKFKIK